MPLKPALAVRGTVAGNSLGTLESKRRHFTPCHTPEKHSWSLRRPQSKSVGCQSKSESPIRELSGIWSWGGHSEPGPQPLVCTVPSVYAAWPGSPTACDPFTHHHKSAPHTPYRPAASPSCTRHTPTYRLASAANCCCTPRDHTPAAVPGDRDQQKQGHVYDSGMGASAQAEQDGPARWEGGGGGGAMY